MNEDSYNDDQLPEHPIQMIVDFPHDLHRLALPM